MYLLINEQVSPQQLTKKPRLFYGYILVAAAVGIQIVAWGIFNSYGIFFKPLISDFGWSRAIISGASSVNQIIIGLAAIVLGNLNDRFGPRILMTCCGIMLGLGYFLMSQVNSVWQLYLFYGVIVGMGLSGTDVILLSTTARWFVKRRGMMSGIVKMGTGAGIMIIPLVVSWLISTYEWRTSYSIIGTTLFIWVTLFSQLLRKDPAQMQQFPDGNITGYTTSRYPEEVGLPLKKATHTRRLWMLCLIYLAVFFCCNTVIIHIVPHVVDLGFPPSFAAIVLAVIGGASIIGRFTSGLSADKIGSKRMLLVCFIILIAALSWLQIAGDSWMLFIFALAYGFCHGGFYSLMSPIVADFFGTHSHGLILGIVIFSGSIGGAIGPLISGRIFDITRNYDIAFLLLLMLASIGFILILSLGQNNLKQSVNKIS
ncbi:MFS transporter [Chloroflexota bacterium]